MPVRPAPLSLGPAGRPLVCGCGDERRENLVDHCVLGHDEAHAEAGVLEWHPVRRLSGRVFAGCDDDSRDIEFVDECVGGGGAEGRARTGLGGGGFGE